MEEWPHFPLNNFSKADILFLPFRTPANCLISMISSPVFVVSSCC